MLNCIIKSFELGLTGALRLESGALSSRTGVICDWEEECSINDLSPIH